MATILVIDDDNGLRIALRTMLEEDKHHVMVARNGQEAMEQLALHKPNLILCDIIMPTMDGWTFLSKVKQNQSFKFIPIVMLSAFDDDEERVRAIEMGADELVSKHLAFRIIRIQVKKILSQNGIKCNDK